MPNPRLNRLTRGGRANRLGVRLHDSLLLVYCWSAAPCPYAALWRHGVTIGVHVRLGLRTAGRISADVATSTSIPPSVIESIYWASQQPASATSTPGRSITPRLRSPDQSRGPPTQRSGRPWHAIVISGVCELGDGDDAAPASSPRRRNQGASGRGSASSPNCVELNDIYELPSSIGPAPMSRPSLSRKALVSLHGHGGSRRIGWATEGRRTPRRSLPSGTRTLAPLHEINVLLPGFAANMASAREWLEAAHVEGLLALYRMQDLIDTLPDHWRLRMTVGAGRC